MSVPLSYPQRWVWVLSKLAAPVCNLPLALRLSGPVDVQTVEAALLDLVDHHQMLRTVFTEVQGVPSQRVLAAGEVAPRVLVEATTEADLAEDLAVASRRPFDLTREIPLHCQLFEIGPADHVLLMNVHHIAVDQWSLELLTRDFSLAYSNRHRGVRHVFSPLPLQYVDYCAWQHRCFGTDADPQAAETAQLAYWRKALASMPSALRLPTTRARQGAARYEAGWVPVEVDAAAHQRLMALGATTRSSVFMIVHAALTAVLTGIGAGEDLPVCTPIAGRGNALLENVVGPFLNTLILRTDSSGDPTFRDLLLRVRAVALDAFDHQDVPFECVLRSVARPAAGRPLTQLCLIVNDGPARSFQLSDAVVRRQPIADRFLMFDLLVDLRARRAARGAAAGLDGTIAYRTDLFDRSAVQPVADGLARVLRAVSEHPDTRLSELARAT